MARLPDVAGARRVNLLAHIYGLELPADGDQLELGPLFGYHPDTPRTTYDPLSDPLNDPFPEER